MRSFLILLSNIGFCMAIDRDHVAVGVGLLLSLHPFGKLNILIYAWPWVNCLDNQNVWIRPDPKYFLFLVVLHCESRVGRSGKKFFAENIFAAVCSK